MFSLFVPSTENVYRGYTPGFKLHIQVMANVAVFLQQKLLCIFLLTGILYTEDITWLQGNIKSI